MMWLSSFPTADPKSTVHLDYGTVNDMSNRSMAALYAKFGLDEANVRSEGALHVHICSRRLDRKSSHSGCESLVTSSLPSDLREHWESFASNLISKSKAHIVVVFGHPATAVYKKYLEEKKITYDAFWLAGFQRYEAEMPYACLEYTDKWKTTVKRLTIFCFHLESFWGTKAEDTTPQVRVHAFRERLIDLTMVLLYDNAYRQAFLSS